MTHKYFAYIDHHGSWKVNELISMEQSRVLLSTLAWKYQVFASIQDYDQYGNILRCPLYFDIDGPKALEDARGLVGACEFLTNVTPRIYFSGSKGFHLIIERKIEHPRCHELARDFANEIGGCFPSVDFKVYTARRMFRIPGSPASKPGYFKVELLREQLFGWPMETIREHAREQRFPDTRHDPSKMHDDQINAWLAIAVPKLPEYTLVHISNVAKDLNLELTPCLRTILTTPAPSGDRHSSVFLLARFLKNCGVDAQSASRLLTSYAHWKSYESSTGDVTKVLTSVYQSQKPSHVGCKGASSDATLLRSHCDQLCPIRTDFPTNPFKDLRKTESK